VPIVPVSIIGSGKIMPKRSLKVRPGRVKLVIDKEINVKDYDIEKRQELVEKVRNIIIKNYDYWREAGTAGIKDMEREAT
jgi:1-acyl-sn-glycerol-3-phosphate acyltransferase